MDAGNEIGRCRATSQRRGTVKILMTVIAFLLSIGTVSASVQATGQQFQQRTSTMIYMVSSRDNPCGSRTVPIRISVQGPRVLTQSLQVLLNTPDPHHPEYFTALEPHDLELRSVTIKDRKST